MWDVVVVGAGLSGFTAAKHLLRKDAQLKILILEGKDRVGGRTVSLKVPAAHGDDVWDLGGQWVGSTQTHVMDLIQELDLEVYPQYAEGKKVHHVGAPEAKARTYTSSIPFSSPLVLLDTTIFLWKIERLCKTVCVDDPISTPNALQYDSMTLHTYMEQHIWTKELRENMGVCSRTVFGMEPSQLSFLYFLVFAAAAGGVLPLLGTERGSAQEFRVKGGTQQLSEKLADWVGRENVLLGSAVTAIEQCSDVVQVRTATQSFDCRAVIVTCPPHLAAKIQYAPALPTERDRLVQSMPVGHLIKFIVTYPTAFWREKGFSGEVVVQAAVGCPFSVTFDATSPSGNPALVGFIAGAQASDWGARTIEDRRNSVILSLQKYLGPEASDFIHYEEKDWAREDFSGGCPVNIMAPGMLSFYHPSLRKPCGRIFWAGTETATLWCGYLSGAVQAGQRAALEVLRHLAPGSPSHLDHEVTGASHNPPAPCKTWAATPTPYRSSTFLVITTATLGTALLLARPQPFRDLIGQALAFVQKLGFKQ